MKGCRPFTEEEIEQISDAMGSLRDKCLFNLGIYTGFRIKEILSLKVKDVMEKPGVINDRVTVHRASMKNKIESRSILLHPKLKKMLLEYITKENMKPYECLFKSQKGVNKPITRQQAWRILKAGAAGMDGKIGTHSTRKTFAARMYDYFKKDLLKTCRALGHKNINSTISYLSFDTAEIDAAIKDW